MTGGGVLRRWRSQEEKELAVGVDFSFFFLTLLFAAFLLEGRAALQLQGGGAPGSKEAELRLQFDSVPVLTRL